MVIQVCVGSSCHLKGSADVVELLQKAVEQHNLEADVVLSGCFCLGECNRTGVTVVVDGTTHKSVTRETFKEFFAENVLKKIRKEGK